MKKIVLRCMLLVISLIVIGCSNDTKVTQTEGESNEKKQNNDLRVALSAEPPTLDLHKTTIVATQQVAHHIFEPLVTLDADFKVVPYLAKSIDVSADGKTITLPIREGIKFHNGKEMTSEDVLATLNRWKELSVVGRTTMANVEIVALDKYTIQLNLPEPSISVLSALAYPQQAAVIMPKEIVEQATEEGIKEYVGTGPFMFEEWKQDQYIHLKKYDGHQPLDTPASGLSGKREALVNNLYFLPVPDEATRVSGVRSGDYDFADEVSIDNYELLKSDANIETVITKPRRYNGLVFNTRDGIFSDVKARQAINAALDLESIMLAAAGNPDFYRLDHGLMFQEQAWYVDSGADKYNQHDINKAKKMLKEIGYNGEQINILGTRDYDFLYNTAVVIKEQLEAIGMNVNLEIYDWPTFSSKRSDGSAWDIFFTYFPFYTDPTQTHFLRSAKTDWPGWYDNKEMTALLEELSATTDFEESKKVFEKVQALYWEEVPAIKLGDYHGLVAQQNYVKGFNYFMDIFFWNVSVQ
jgi:peptide/nickel transport system substrate-binding protein